MTNDQNAKPGNAQELSELTIPGDTRVIELDGWLLAKGFPNNERAYLPSTRVATGGNPRYEYSSNSSAVSVNASTGQVNINSEGTAIITVKDQSQPPQTASYEIQVTGEHQTLEYLGSMNWEDANKSGQLLTIDQFISLVSRFGPGFPVNGLAWTVHPQKDQPGVYHSVFMPGGHGTDWDTWSAGSASLLVLTVL